MNVSTKIWLFFITVTLVLQNCGTPENGDSANAASDKDPVTDSEETMDISLEYLYSIGENLEFDEPGYLLMPGSVTTDGKGNIFIADSKKILVNMYSSEGNFLKSFGGEGQGPGEFEEVSAIAIDDVGNLLVLDRMSFKLARFTVNNGNVEEHLFEDMSQINMTTLVPLEDHRFAGIYVESITPDQEDDIIRAVRVYRFGDRVKESDHFEIFTHQFNKAQPLENRMGRVLGHKLTNLDNKLVAVGNTVYMGKLFIINFNNDDDIIETKNNAINPPYYVQFDTRSRDISGFMSSYGSTGIFHFQILYYSMMLEGSRGYLFHIFKKNEEEGGAISDEMEIYTKDGELLMYKPVSSFLPDGEERYRMYSHLDEDRRLFVKYFYDDRDPEIRVYQLHIPGLDENL